MCRQLVELVTDYLEGALEPGMRSRVAKHLVVCEHCEGYVAQVRRLLDLTAELVPTAAPQLRRRLTFALGHVTLAELDATSVAGWPAATQPWRGGPRPGTRCP